MINESTVFGHDLSSNKLHYSTVDLSEIISALNKCKLLYKRSAKDDKVLCIKHYFLYQPEMSVELFFL